MSEILVPIVGIEKILVGVVSKHHFIRIANANGWIKKIDKRRFVNQDVLDKFLEERETCEKIKHEFFTTKDLAIAKGVTEGTVREWVKGGLVKAVMYKYQYYIEPIEFDRIIGMKTFREVAGLLSISKKALEAAHEKGRIKATKFFSVLVIDKEEYERIKKDVEAGKMFRISKWKGQRKSLNEFAQKLEVSEFNLLEYQNKKFSELSIKQKETLILSAKSGENDAINLILNMMKNRIEIESATAIKRWRRVEMEECLHYGQIGVLQAIVNYPNFEVDFEAYARVYARWAIFKNIVKDLSEVFKPL
ncbi:MAG: hypothetical protein Q7R99_02455 [bacterium]|nr:hypothetical protein [bacterium]